VRVKGRRRARRRQWRGCHAAAVGVSGGAQEEENGASEEGERGTRRYGERGARAGAIECHPAADAGVRAPRGGRALPWPDAARARAEVGKGTVRTRAGLQALAGQKRGAGPEALKNHFSFIF
jgi:hypothetical protein